MRRKSFPLLCCIAMTGALLYLSLAAGCADDSHPTSHPGDEALRDPMYKPSLDDYPDISGGSLTHFDKEGFKKDMDDVFNP
jgi:hypothetical protein